ncbi:cilia- and flagella-associated protein 54-like [Hypomesus transpacificus]|uniref:cilia- and flagella-associated protein 54-like n=1 Tax=Hypomesus transpacificus TaxID=137520 RepID=UPI001F0780D5|nr:cilia- and flagella-associated protein 54-like [Hypomesus transpacificus]
MLLGGVPAQRVLEPFLECVQLSLQHCHSLQLVRKCYQEMALVYLHLHHSSSAPQDPSHSGGGVLSPVLRRSSMTRGMSVSGAYMLLYWVCVRAAAQVWRAMLCSSQLCGPPDSTSSLLPLTCLHTLPRFALNDLLNPCGGLDQQGARTSRGSPESRMSIRKCSLLTWLQLSRYYTHLSRLCSTMHPVCPQSVEGLLCVSGGGDLQRRLFQLHVFFCSHMPSYKKTCSPPSPPLDLLQLPQTLQISPVLCGALREKFPECFADKPQLCMQWYRPPLVSPDNQDTVLLLFAVSSSGVSCCSDPPLHCGQQLLSMDRVRVVHTQLCAACVAVSLAPPPPAPPSPAPSPAPRQLRHPGPSDTHVLILQEKVRSCCSAITHLLQPGLQSTTLPQVEVSGQTLIELERCFNPGGGAILEEKSLIGWLDSLLS